MGGRPHQLERDDRAAVRAVDATTARDERCRRTGTARGKEVFLARGGGRTTNWPLGMPRQEMAIANLSKTATVSSAPLPGDRYQPASALLVTGPGRGGPRDRGGGCLGSRKRLPEAGDGRRSTAAEPTLGHGGSSLRRAGRARRCSWERGTSFRCGTSSPRPKASTWRMRCPGWPERKDRGLTRTRLRPWGRREEAEEWNEWWRGATRSPEGWCSGAGEATPGGRG